MGGSNENLLFNEVANLYKTLHHNLEHVERFLASFSQADINQLLQVFIFENSDQVPQNLKPFEVLAILLISGIHRKNAIQTCLAAILQGQLPTKEAMECLSEVRLWLIQRSQCPTEIESILEFLQGNLALLLESIGRRIRINTENSMLVINFVVSLVEMQLERYPDTESSQIIERSRQFYDAVLLNADHSSGILAIAAMFVDDQRRLKLALPTQLHKVKSIIMQYGDELDHGLRCDVFGYVVKLALVCPLVSWILVLKRLFHSKSTESHSKMCHMLQMHFKTHSWSAIDKIFAKLHLDRPKSEDTTKESANTERCSCWMDFVFMLELLGCYHPVLGALVNSTRPHVSSVKTAGILWNAITEMTTGCEKDEPAEHLDLIREVLGYGQSKILTYRRASILLDTAWIWLDGLRQDQIKFAMTCIVAVFEAVPSSRESLLSRLLDGLELLNAQSHSELASLLIKQYPQEVSLMAYQLQDWISKIVAQEMWKLGESHMLLLAPLAGHSRDFFNFLMLICRKLMVRRDIAISTLIVGIYCSLLSCGTFTELNGMGEIIEGLHGLVGCPYIEQSILFDRLCYSLSCLRMDTQIKLPQDQCSFFHENVCLYVVQRLGLSDRDLMSNKQPIAMGQLLFAKLLEVATLEGFQFRCICKAFELLTLLEMLGELSTTFATDLIRHLSIYTRDSTALSQYVFSDVNQGAEIEKILFERLRALCMVHAFILNSSNDTIEDKIRLFNSMSYFKMLSNKIEKSKQCQWTVASLVDIKWSVLVQLGSDFQEKAMKIVVDNLDGSNSLGLGSLACLVTLFRDATSQIPPCSGTTLTSRKSQSTWLLQFSLELRSYLTKTFSIQCHPNPRTIYDCYATFDHLTKKLKEKLGYAIELDSIDDYRFHCIRIVIEIITNVGTKVAKQAGITSLRNLMFSSSIAMTNRKVDEQIDIFGLFSMNLCLELESYLERNGIPLRICSAYIQLLECFVPLVETSTTTDEVILKILNSLYQMMCSHFMAQANIIRTLCRICVNTNIVHVTSRVDFVGKVFLGILFACFSGLEDSLKKERLDFHLWECSFSRPIVSLSRTNQVPLLSSDACKSVALLCCLTRIEAMLYQSAHEDDCCILELFVDLLLCFHIILVKFMPDLSWYHPSCYSKLVGVLHRSLALVQHLIPAANHENKLYSISLLAISVGLKLSASIRTWVTDERKNRALNVRKEKLRSLQFKLNIFEMEAANAISKLRFEDKNNPREAFLLRQFLEVSTLKSDGDVKKRMVKKNKISHDFKGRDQPKTNHSNRLRSRHPYIDECLQEEAGTDTYADLEDFIAL